MTSHQMACVCLPLIGFTGRGPVHKSHRVRWWWLSLMSTRAHAVRSICRYGQPGDGPLTLLPHFVANPAGVERTCSHFPFGTRIQPEWLWHVLWYAQTHTAGQPPPPSPTITTQAFIFHLLNALGSTWHRKAWCHRVSSMKYQQRKKFSLDLKQ